MTDYDEERMREYSTVRELPETFTVRRTEANTIVAKQLEDFRKNWIDSSGQSQMLVCDVVE